MKAKIVIIDPAHPEAAFSRARDVVRSGGVIAYPTETYYGLGVDPGNPAAVGKLFHIKGRQADQPILLLIKDASEVSEWVAGISPLAGSLMERFWPGPLTLVFSAKPGVLPELTAGTGRIGLRVPGNEVTLGLLQFMGTALTGTSANRTGRPGLETAGEVAGELGGMVDLILDGGRTIGGKPSTVADVSADRLRVIREGAVLLKDNE